MYASTYTSARLLGHISSHISSLIKTHLWPCKKKSIKRRRYHGIHSEEDVTRSDIEILRFWKTESLAAVFCIGFNLFDGVVKLKGTSLYIPHCFSPWEVEQYGGGTFQLHQQQCKPWLLLLRVSLITLLEEKNIKAKSIYLTDLFPHFQCSFLHH